MWSGTCRRAVTKGWGPGIICLMTISMISGKCHRKQKENAVEPRSTDTRLIQTSVYNSQFCLSQQRKSSYIFYKINLFNTDTQLMWTLCMSCGSSVEPIELPSCLTSCLLIAYPGTWSLSHSPVVEITKKKSLLVFYGRDHYLEEFSIIVFKCYIF